MKNENKVALDDVKKYAEKTYESIEEVDSDGLIFNVKKHLGLGEMAQFVNEVVNACFNENDVFMPEARDFAIRSCVFEYYTNIELPDDMNERYDLLYSLQTAYFDILDTIEKTQLIEMCKAADDRVGAKLQGIINDINTYANQILNKLDDLADKYEAMFAGVDADDVSEAIKAIAKSGLDESKFVEAYIAKTKVGQRGE